MKTIGANIAMLAAVFLFSLAIGEFSPFNTGNTQTIQELRIRADSLALAVSQMRHGAWRRDPDTLWTSADSSTTVRTSVVLSCADSARSRMYLVFEYIYLIPESADTLTLDSINISYPEGWPK